MDIFQLVQVVVFCVISLSVQARGRGVDNNEKPKNSGEIESRDTQAVGLYLPIRFPEQNIYEDFELGIFGDYYKFYQPFMNSLEYETMKDTISNDTLTCANFHTEHNGSYFGFFTCPLPFEPGDYSWCCGAPYAEMCCFDTGRFRFEAWVGGLAFGGIIIFVLLFGLFCYGVLGQGWCRKSDGRPSDEKDDY